MSLQSFLSLTKCYKGLKDVAPDDHRFEMLEVMERLGLGDAEMRQVEEGWFFSIQSGQTIMNISLEKTEHPFLPNKRQVCFYIWYNVNGGIWEPMQSLTFPVTVSIDEYLISLIRHELAQAFTKAQE